MVHFEIFFANAYISLWRCSTFREGNSFSFYATKQKIPTYDFLSIINILKASIKMHLFFTRERIDMTERWMIRSWDFVSTQTSSYFILSYGKFHEWGICFCLVSFLYVSYSIASFSVSHSIAKSVHTLQCVYSAILIWLPQSFCIYLKWLEVEYVFLLFLFRRNFVTNLEMWYVFCKMQYMCPFCKMFFTD